MYELQFALFGYHLDVMVPAMHFQADAVKFVARPHRWGTHGIAAAGLQAGGFESTQ
jgi:hypothetical protein